jgi:PPM family protein phosphatase
MRFALGNAQHIGARQQQQDAFGFSDPSDKAFVAHGGFLGVVADGMGGLTQGSEASSTAVRSFLQAYKLKTAKESVAEALTRSLLEANRAVLRVAENASLGEVGTTLAAAVMRGDSVYWISAGDSRIYWLRGTSLTRLTADHVYATKLNRESAQGKISRTEARSHPERASLTSYLGQTELELVDRNNQPLTVHPDDCVILCSDGLYRALAEGEIVGAFRDDLQHACDMLVKQVLAKQRKQQDNLTIIALKSQVRAWWSRRKLSARLLLVVLTALLLAALAGGAGYWYSRRSPAAATAPQKPVSAQPSSNTGEGGVTNPQTPIVEEPKQPGARVETSSESQKQKEHPKKGASNQPRKVDTGEPPSTVPSPTGKTPPPEQMGTKPSSQQSGAAGETNPPAGQPTDASKGSTPGQPDDNEKVQKQASPTPNPDTAPPQNPNPPNPNPPKPNPPNPNRARETGAMPRFGSWLGYTK